MSPLTGPKMIEMTGVKMRRTKAAATSLIEVLVVIVVFLVGILAVVQTFPPGLAALRTTRNNTLANSLARSETQRIQGNSNQIAEMIVSGYYNGSTTQFIVDSTIRPEELKPPMDNPVANTGLIDVGGNVIVGGVSYGRWDLLSGANVFTKILGEGRPVPGARYLQNGNNLLYGGFMQLMFGPINYARDVTGIGMPGLLQLYGNDLVQRIGNTDNNPAYPSPNDNRARDWSYYFVPGENATSSSSTPFPNDDQIWIGRPHDKVGIGGTYHSSAYRISFSFNYPDSGGVVRQYDIVALVRPVDGAAVYSDQVRYTVISLKQLIGIGAVQGGTFVPGSYLGADPGSVRVQRAYDEIPVANAFTSGYPYEYKVVSPNFGSVLINPAANGYKVTTQGGLTVPLLARTDYSVYDWRVIHDDFHVPTGDGASGTTTPTSIKLILNSIKSTNTRAADGTTYKGFGGPGGPDKSLWIPDATGTLKNPDFILQDVETGGVILGDTPGNPKNGYIVDKTNGVVTFIDVDGDPSNGLNAYLAVPTGDPVAPWSVELTPRDIRGRAVRALYRGNQEFAVQSLKSASNYRVTNPAAPGSLGRGECTVGGVNFGTGNRLYFSVSDLGEKVTIGESWYTDGTNFGALMDKDYVIQSPDGTGLPYIQLPTGLTFDFTKNNGYAVRRVRGASLRVRVLWNPSSFILGVDQATNYNNMMTWAQQWRRVETDSFEAGGKN